jgi:hypothetical protein
MFVGHFSPGRTDKLKLFPQPSDLVGSRKVSRRTETLSIMLSRFGEDLVVPHLQMPAKGGFVRMSLIEYDAARLILY